MESNFYYFAYGSNLLSHRIAKSIPNPQLKCRATLKDYEIVFSGSMANRWYGSVANIKFKKNSYVYGAVYTVTHENLQSLDIQEGVKQGHYKRLEVDVISLDDDTVMNCIVYVRGDENDPIGLPSPAYKNVIINGAKEIKLPENYIKFLRSFEDNGYSGPIDVDLLPKWYLSS